MPESKFDRLIQRVALRRFEKEQKRIRSAYLLAEGMKAVSMRLNGESG